MLTDYTDTVSISNRLPFSPSRAKPPKARKNP